MASTALDPARVYRPVGRCIYCGKGADEIKLTDEHIIPLSFGGTWLLPAASCKKCAKPTSRVEGHVAKGMWDYARVQLGIPSRRPKERPQFLEMEMHDQTTRHIPVLDMPPVILSFIFPPAEALFGLPPSDTPVGGRINIANISAEAEKKFVDISRQGRVRLNPRGFGPSRSRSALQRSRTAMRSASLVWTDSARRCLQSSWNATRVTPCIGWAARPLRNRLVRRCTNCLCNGRGYTSLAGTR